MDWRTVELLGYTHYSSKGYRILVSLVRGDSYDFVAEKDGEFIRVNVKRAGLKSKNQSSSWSISQSSGSSRFSKSAEVIKPIKVDVYLTYLPNSNRFIEIPGDFFDGALSKSKLIPKNLL